MDVNKYKKQPEVREVVRVGATLPSDIFVKKFNQYLFFDNDICTSDDLINATQFIICECFSPDSVASVFAYSDLHYLGRLGTSDDWVAKIPALSALMYDSGDYGGLIIIDNKQQWALVQSTPVEDGVLAINSDKQVSKMPNILDENFIDCNAIRKWLLEREERDKNLVKKLGRDYLMEVLKNYN